MEEFYTCILIISLLLSTPFWSTPIPPNPVLCLHLCCKLHQVQFVLIVPSWTCGSLLEHGWLARGHTFQRTDFLSPLQQLLIISTALARDGVSCSPLPSMLGFCLAWVWAGLVYAVTAAEFRCGTLLCCVQKIVSWWPPTVPLTLTVFPLPLPWALNLGRRVHVNPFGAELSPISYVLYLTSCRPLC